MDKAVLDKSFYFPKEWGIHLFMVFVFPLVFVHSHDGGPGIPFWSPRAGTPAQRFQLAKRSTPELIAFMRRMPKGADLHMHPGGSSYVESIIDKAAKDGLNYDTNTHLFTRETVKSPGIIPISELKNNPHELYTYLNHASMRGWFPNISNGHDHFFSSFQYAMSGKPLLEEMVVDILRRKQYENLQYIELMAPCFPAEIKNTCKESLPQFDPLDLDGAFNRLKPLLDDKKITTAISTFLDARDQKINQLMAQAEPLTGNTGPLVMRYVPYLNRLDDTKSFFISALLIFHTITHDPRVVGLNIAAPEDSPAAQENFDIQMTILDFLWQKMGPVNISLHAGELVLRESPVEPMMNRISLSVKKGHAQRIGHGVSIAWEENVVPLLQKMRQTGILVEICLTSNEGILGVKDNDHPFNFYRRAGVPISLNTDDEGINRSNLTMEFVKAIQRYHLNYQEVKTLVRHSLQYSFLPGLSLYVQGNYQQLVPEFATLRSRQWRPSPKAKKIMQENPKLNRQVVLERALVEFETYLMDGFGANIKEEKK